MMTFEEARAQFPVLERIAYLNAGTCGPLARQTGEAMAEAACADLEGGRSGKAYFEGVLARRDQMRTRLAGLLGVEPGLVALTSSTTDGCNIVLSGLSLGLEDEIVTTDAEHPGLLLPLHASGARVRAAPVTKHPASSALEVVLGEVGPRTRLIAVSHVLWTTGHVMPVHELKRETGLPVLVDGAQSVGAIPAEAGAIDFYTVSCQKWLCGPDPLGGLYVADPESLRVAVPTYLSQSSFERDGSFVPKPGAARFDSGWISRPSLMGLLAALDVAPEWCFARSAEMAERCRAALEARFDVVTEPGQATLVSFRPPGDAPEAVARAFDAGVVVRELPGTGLVRASCGYWTNEDDIDRLVKAVNGRT